MTSRQLVDFVEAALAAHGVAKVIPGDEVLRQQARRRLESKLTGELIAQHAEDIAQRAAEAALPPDLVEQVATLLGQSTRCGRGAAKRAHRPAPATGAGRRRDPKAARVANDGDE
jgi:hypothetical protein